MSSISTEMIRVSRMTPVVCALSSTSVRVSLCSSTSIDARDVILNGTLEDNRDDCQAKLGRFPLDLLCLPLLELPPMVVVAKLDFSTGFVVVWRSSLE